MATAWSWHTPPSNAHVRKMSSPTCVRVEGRDNFGFKSCHVMLGEFPTFQTILFPSQDYKDHRLITTENEYNIILRNAGSTLGRPSDPLCTEHVLWAIPTFIPKTGDFGLGCVLCKQTLSRQTCENHNPVCLDEMRKGWVPLQRPELSVLTRL
jgi:hypothetical protein